MAIAAAMNNPEENKEDPHEHDMVMPGFRFHPTEEELIEFYLRRKVEGKRFNVELITFLDLYRYDPWELPALAAIGEKEWYFYVPRDRKYRNGDRPNRVTTSGYWKATGADRMIRTENFRAIGLKKTLVFYSGKAPKGIRTSWIMNEYRLPQHETERLQKAEISLCRVYKRACIEDHPSLPRSLHTRASSSRTSTTHTEKKQQSITTNQTSMEAEKMSETSGSSSTDVGFSRHNYAYSTTGLASTTSNSNAPQMEDDRLNLIPTTWTSTIFSGSSSLVQHNVILDDLHRLVSLQQFQNNHYLPSQFFTLQQQLQPPLPPPAPGMVPGTFPDAAFSDRLWEWNPTEGSKDFPGNLK
ncbi:hypothetical protein NMG60_11032299 [Bertholletia excelsa]